MSETKSFLEQILDKARAAGKHIVLPEGYDSRIQEAAVQIVKEGIAELTLIGEVDAIGAALKEKGCDAGKVNIVKPSDSADLDEFASGFYELRKAKGISEQQAREAVLDEVYFGTMMVKAGKADGLVAGAAHSTADTVRPALQIIKARKGLKTVSSMFFMCSEEATYLYADCGVIEEPTEEQLVDIALATAHTGIQFGFEPRVAMLSYSTKGSASGSGAVKAANAAKAAIARFKDEFGEKIVIDGELQFDAAFVPSVAAKKAPDSPLKGQANTFIFPDLGAGNLAYKMSERLAKMDAYGPILQGLNQPVNDLSRGCSADDVVATAAITALQAC